MAIPLFATSHEQYAERLSQRIADVVASGRYILGPEVEAFENEFAGYLGAKHCIGTGNGTDALTIVIRSLGLGSGDTILVPSFTFYATAEAIVNAGAIPRFCDVDPETLCITPETVRQAISPEVTAILAVDLFGNVAPVPELAQFGLPVIEDAAQAAGARLGNQTAGTLGNAAAFSFFPSKNLFGVGDGGAIVTDDDSVAETARLLRTHGTVDKETHTLVGYNSRLDAIQAVVLRELLPLLDDWTAARRTIASEYETNGLARLLQLPRATEGARHSYHLYAARHPQADTLIAGLNRLGVGARGYYRRPIHRQPAMAQYLRGGEPNLPGTEEAAKTNVALPMGPDLPQEQVPEIVQACATALSQSLAPGV